MGEKKAAGNISCSGESYKHQEALRAAKAVAQSTWKTKFCWQNSAEQNSASGKQNPVGKRGWGLNVLLFCLVGNGSADRNLLGYFQKMQSADFQVGKEHRKGLCSFFRPSRSRKMGFSCCCLQLQMGQCLLIFYFFCRTI